MNVQLLHAIRTGDVDAVVRLLANGADANYVSDYGLTVLMVASQHVCFTIAKCLTANGADVNHADSDGWTALMWASLRGHLAMVEHLVANGAEVNHANNYGVTALMLASQHGHLATVKCLTANGADANHIDRDGRTALIRALHSDKLAVVKFLSFHHFQQSLSESWVCDQTTFEYFPYALQLQCAALATLWSIYSTDSPNTLAVLPIELLHMLLRMLCREH